MESAASAPSSNDGVQKNHLLSPGPGMGHEGLTHHIRNLLLPQDDFPRQLPHSAAPPGSWCLEVAPARQSHYFLPSWRNLRAGQRVQSHGNCLLLTPLQQGTMPKYLPLTGRSSSERPCRGAVAVPCSVPAKLSIKGLSSLIET